MTNDPAPPINTPCPCGSGLTYTDCCAPLHQGTLRATTAKQLMRSRYCAFALGEIDYLIRTTSKPQRLDKTTLAEWTASTQWQRLEIIDTSAGQAEDRIGEVEFKAWYYQSGTTIMQCHHERSRFINEPTGWIFIDPNIDSAPQPGRNSPCPCGSGRKFKRCCAE